MSGKFDWVNPEANFDTFCGKPDKPYFTDWTQPLPLTGIPAKLKIPYRFFFNKDLDYLQHAHETSKHRYASSLTLSVPAARFENHAIKETAPIQQSYCALQQ